MKLPPKAQDVISGKVEQPELPTPPVPKDRETWASAIRSELDREGIRGQSQRREIVNRTVELAKAGVPWATHFLAEREEGKPTQAVSVDGKDGGPVAIALVKYEMPAPPQEAPLKEGDK